MSKKAIYLPIILITFVLNISSQTVHELEQKLYFHPGDKGDDHMPIARKILTLDPLNKNAIEFICENYKIIAADSVNIFLDNLIAKYPSNTDLYLFKAEYFKASRKEMSDKEYDIKKLNYLMKAYSIDKRNPVVNYKIAETYYFDFLRPYNKYKFGIGIKVEELPETRKTVKIKSVLHNPAANALYFFRNVEKYGFDSLKQIVYYPIQQLRYHLYKSAPEKLTYSKRVSDSFIYPPWYFTNIKSGWHKDLSENYLALAGWSVSEIKSLGRFFYSINEPSLFQKKLQSNQDIIRFCWFRSFNSTICIRLERNRNDINLTWKEISCKDSLQKQIIRVEHKKISPAQYQNIISLLDKSGFDSFPMYQYYPMCDGNTWMVEKLTGNKFKVYHSNLPGNSFKKACYYLLSLTDVKFEKEKDSTTRTLENKQRISSIILYAVIGLGIICLILGVFWLILRRYRLG